MGHQSKSIYETVLQRIRAGVLIPGDAVDEAALCKEFKVSGTPVREALINLESIGLIERAPRAGARIFKPNTERLIGLIEIYAELEGTTAQFAARRISPEQAKALVKTVEACEQFAANATGKSATGYYRLNIDFHLRIVDAANNADLAALMAKSSSQLISYFRARHRLQGDVQRSAAEHRIIAEAILSGDAESARALIIQHVTIDGATILDVIRKMNERF